MKQFKSYAAAALALLGVGALTSCSNDEPTGIDNNPMVADSYIRVNIADLPDFGASRAEDPVKDPNEYYDGGDEGKNERKISSIAFYFFNEDGTPFKMENNNINGGFKESNLVRPLTNLDPTDGVLASTLVLGKAAGTGWKGTVPAKMVAVANIGPVATADAAYNKLANLNLDDLGKELITAKTSTPASGQFVMSTAVYNDGGKVIRWSEIGLQNIKTTPDLAVENPVTVYMERLTAKVEVNLNATAIANSNRYKVATRPVVDANGQQVTKDFYAEILGWELNGTVSNGYLLKDIAGIENPFPGWTYPLSHRSFWANTPVLGGTSSLNANATKLNTAFNWENLDNVFDPNDPGSYYGYCYENTLQSKVERNQEATSQATKVLLKARIVDESGTAQNLISWAGTLYTENDFKMMVAKFMTEEGETPNPNLVTFSRSQEKGKIHVVNTLYDNHEVFEFRNIRRWKDGVCYYIVNIKHAENNGENVYGVVRNHWYKISINSIAGLGTPGGTGDHEIPENPTPELESFVAATVEILPWHIIRFAVDVES